MRITIMLLVIITSGFVAEAQEMSRTQVTFTKYLLGKSGCSAGFPSELKETQVKEGSDGSVLYLSRVNSNGYTFTVAVQKLSVPMSRSRTEQITFLQQYMNGLKSQ